LPLVDLELHEIHIRAIPDQPYKDMGPTDEHLSAPSFNHFESITSPRFVSVIGAYLPDRPSLQLGSDRWFQVLSLLERKLLSIALRPLPYAHFVPSSKSRLVRLLRYITILPIYLSLGTHLFSISLNIDLLFRAVHTPSNHRIPVNRLIGRQLS
jgi:hypothetical protein